MTVTLQGMQQWIAGISVWQLTLAMVAGCVAFVVVAKLLLERYVPAAALREENELAGFLFATVSVLYAVLLGFVVIVTWEQFAHADAVALAEASAAKNLALEVNVYDPRDRTAIRAALIAYARAIVDDEWPSMQHGSQSRLAEDRLTTLSDLVVSVQPRSERQRLVYADTLGVVRAILDNRDERLLLNSEGLPSVMWWTLLGGGLITVVFALCFGSQRLRFQLFLCSLVSATIALMFVVISELNYPYRGETSVRPHAWQQFIVTMERQAPPHG